MAIGSVLCRMSLREPWINACSWRKIRTRKMRLHSQMPSRANAGSITISRVSRRLS
ncbi:hypothetical protein D3C80_2195440 [compost metagenome]